MSTAGPSRQQLYDDYGTSAEPCMTLVGHFKATANSRSCDRYMGDHITTRVSSNGSRKVI